MSESSIRHSKDSALEAALKYIEEALQEEDTEVCLVIANTETGHLRVLGLNMPEEEVPYLLTAAAEEVAEAIVEQYDKRIVN